MKGKNKATKTKKAKTNASLQPSFLAAGNLQYLENIYSQYLATRKNGGANGLSEDWLSTFGSLPPLDGNNRGSDIGDGRGNGQTQAAELSYQDFITELQQLSATAKAPAQSTATAPAATPVLTGKQHSYDALTNAYRIYGHKNSKMNPLQCTSRFNNDELKLTSYGLSEADLNKDFSAKLSYFGKDRMTLQETIRLLEKTYCGSLASEFMYISDKAKKQWLLQKLENSAVLPNLPSPERIRILERLVAAHGLENSLARKYPGTKRFGLEGGETLIPMVDNLVQSAGDFGTKEIVIAMAHRGRLNMLVNILGKNPASLFDEFDGKVDIESSTVLGDVKYHQGFSCNLDTPGGEVHLALAFNPSHLEIVAPVAEGSVRARQDRRKDATGKDVLPLIIHGDASFAGQGVVMETLQMSNLNGFKTGGTVHIILNNQIGFTLSAIGDARSTEYASDVAKILEAPIFHVNGDDPEAAVYACKVALEYRMKYQSDVVIDLVCYRRHGHNEADEPAMTQPVMYSEIRKHPSVTDIYFKQLENAGVVQDSEFRKMQDEYRKHLDKGDHVSLSLTKKPNPQLFVDWHPYLNHKWKDDFDTSIKLPELKEIGKKLLKLPADFKLNKQVERVYANRGKMLAGEMPVDWGYAELLAYGSLVQKGFNVRMTGQDSRRGTFSHRHAVVHHSETGDSHCSLTDLQNKGARFNIFDSYLSEEAAMAFEYGYAATDPTTLVIWEAQFGDFANGAQVVIDQFLSSGETKWGRLCGLALFLPHGYEGQGPEHSSARVERYLQLCADNNMQVCVPSTAGQMFHLLRRQIIRPLRKPLVVMMPKSLLRKEESSAMIGELAEGQFATFIPETDKAIKKDKASRIILCSGKIYYELIKHRDSEKIQDVAVVRVEQLYPFPHEGLAQYLKGYGKIKAAGVVSGGTDEPRRLV